jgi:hypothetical protein
VVDASLGIPARSKTNQIFFLAAIVTLWVLPLTGFWFLLVRASLDLSANTTMNTTPLRSLLNLIIVGLSTFLGVAASPLGAADGTYDNLQILQGLTLRQHAVMEGGLTLRNPAAGISPSPVHPL